MDFFSKKDLVALWHEHGFRAKKAYGQNFLVDRNVRDKMISFIGPARGDRILEIGPGFGEMTIALAARSAHVTAVEIDARIVKALAGGVFRGIENITVVRADFMKHNIGPCVTKIVGNLPYYATTPILEKIFSAGQVPAKETFVMVQREYGERILAGPGDEDYSALSCFVQSRARAEKLMTVKRTCFFPAPAVDSVFLRLIRFGRILPEVKDEELFSRVIRQAFGQRRKTVLNSLSGAHAGLGPKALISDALETAGVPHNARPENLSLVEFARISDALTGMDTRGGQGGVT
ncbi:MAG: 16S rRNA (adenine(1518)-N(6)/adenine(1519)-N(6))-dimethyltransferase RsmA [Candidatus Omnitrophota bacterium]